MKLYNTLTRQIEDIRPQHSPEVTVYTCGPTVYDYPHVGNWFTFIRYDLLIRTLKSTGLKPKWVMNITDVGHLVSDADEGEDKLEKGAQREGKTAWDIAEHYTQDFIKGLELLNFISPDYLPKATEHISEQIELVQLLETKGYTYQISDGVYFDTAKFPNYADFAQLDLDEQQAGARVELNPEKRNPTDFALWKFSPSDRKRDMEWDSPWGKGFPGWHLECSAMSMKYLGETIDIHSGGIDHVPVHHTNEIAQSEAITGKPFAHYWMHTNHILINDEKISKSLGNGITLQDIQAQGYSLDAFRLHVLESHYRSQSKFSWDSLQAAQNRLQSLQAMAAIRFQKFGEKAGVAEADINESKHKIQEALENDLNTPQALAELSQLSEDITTIGVVDASREAFERFVLWVDQLLGLKLATVSDISEEQKQLIVTRELARESRDWARSDDIRDQLAAHNIGLRDTHEGPVWFPL